MKFFFISFVIVMILVFLFIKEYPDFVIGGYVLYLLLLALIGTNKYMDDKEELLKDIRNFSDDDR